MVNPPSQVSVSSVTQGIRVATESRGIQRKSPSTEFPLDDIIKVNGRGITLDVHT
jgi:hypothetical protein